MELSIKNPFSMEGSFAIHKTNVVTGEVTRYPEQHNLIVDSAKLALMTNTPDYYTVAIYNYNGIMFGSGTVEPTSDDVSVTTPIWGCSKGSTHSIKCADGTIRYTSVKVATGRTIKQVWSDDFKTFTTVIRVVVPADAKYTGKLTELGFCMCYYEGPENGYGLDDNATMLSHALLKDAEGNPYTIDKTDIEQLTVDYSFSITSTDPHVYLMNAYWNYIKNVFTHSISGGASYSKVRFQIQPTAPIIKDKSCFMRFGTVGDPGAPGFTFTPQGSVASEKEYYVSNKVISGINRLPRIWTYNGHFINEILVGTSRYPIIFDFPDETTFPNQTITDMPVGIGDGDTIDFTPPLPMWVANTEKVYIDGALLTRGIDYTCDNFNNLSENIELFPSTYMTIIDAPWGKSAASGGYNYIRYICPYDGTSGASNILGSICAYRLNGSNRSTGVLRDIGDYWTVELPLDKYGLDYSVDTLYLWYSTSGLHLKIEASNDASTWDTIADDLAIAYIGNSISSYDKSRWTQLHLDSAVTYRYWKLTMLTTPRDVSSYPEYSIGLIMRRTGRPIHFTTPPAAGSVITMDADIDRPWKDDKHVVDVSCTVQF